MIAVRASVGLTEALLLLRAYAEQRSMMGVAHDVVGGTLRFPPLTATPKASPT
ncbi:MAG: hypothetical protein L0H96_25435 [Humibacillus sp.]|nr:hypothetical protein [Humibacillus sp.]